LSRVHDVIDGFGKEVANYEESTAIEWVVYKSINDRKNFRIFLPQWKEGKNETQIPFYKLIDKLYVSSYEFKVYQDEAKYALMNILCLNHPETSQFYSMRSPRVAEKVRHRAAKNLKTMMMISFSHLCIYLNAVDRRMLILLFQHLTHCNPEYRTDLLRHFQWTEKCRDIWTYVRIAIILEGDRAFLIEVDELIKEWHLGSKQILCEGNIVIKRPNERSANGFSRSYSESDVELPSDLTRSTPRPSNVPLLMSRSTPASPSTSTQNSHEKYIYFPFVNFAEYTTLVFMAQRLKSITCFQYLRDSYEDLFDQLLKCSTPFDQIDKDLPPTTILEMLASKE
jgi:hypothetical protein